VIYCFQLLLSNSTCAATAWCLRSFAEDDDAAGSAAAAARSAVTWTAEGEAAAAGARVEAYLGGGSGGGGGSVWEGRALRILLATSSSAFEPSFLESNGII